MRYAAAIIVLWLATAGHASAVEPPAQEQVQSDISTREIAIQSNFTGIEIVLFGAIDFTSVPTTDETHYDVIMVVRGPSEPMVTRRKERKLGLWVNGPSEAFSSVPSFYAVLASRPLRAIAPEATLKQLGVGFAALDFGAEPTDEVNKARFRSSLIRLKEERNLFLESDDAISFIGRSLFRGSVDLPVSVPIGTYTTQVYLFRDGRLLSQDDSTLQVHKVGFERIIYLLAFRYPFIYGLIAVVIAVVAGLVVWAIFGRRE
ncbi:MAG TPA: TIGR02186 family protein [Methyloceanibacter sp.]